MAMADLKASILETVGTTPLVRINRLNPSAQVEIYAKLEGYNPLGSVKDRIARAIIEAAAVSGEMTRDKIILESSSGNMGIGVAMVGAAKGYRVLITMPEKVSVERRQILKALGAELILTPGGSDGAWEKADELYEQHPDRYFWVQQYSNPDNVRVHYETTAQEIWEQTDGQITALVAGLGSAGTIVGCGQRLKEYNPTIRVIAVEPEPGHAQQGLRNLSESRVPEIYDPSKIDETVVVTDREAFAMARELARKEGIFTGISSGSAMHVTVQTASVLTDGLIVAILPDRGEKYLSTPLCSFEE